MNSLGTSSPRTASPAPRRALGLLAGALALLFGASGGGIDARAQSAPDGLAPLESFRDCGLCPEMVVIPSGVFQMGAHPDEAGAADAERPQHEVSVPRFAIGRYELTVGAFRAFVKAAAYDMSGSRCSRYDDGVWGPATASWIRPGFEQSDDHPVVCVSEDDIAAYLAWLSDHAGARYRLPSEAEWEYAARAGVETSYLSGETIARADANYGDDVCCKAKAEGADRWVHPAPVGSFAPNAWGLHDIHGNVWEPVADCWRDSYEGAPSDGSVWAGRAPGDDYCHVVLRGGSWLNTPDLLRLAGRYRAGRQAGLGVGFRVARTLDAEISQPGASSERRRAAATDRGLGSAGWGR